MRALAGAVLASALAAAAAAPTDAQCSVVTKPAPCGQASDSEQRCLSKGCCYNNASSTVPCFYPSYDAVPIKYVHMVQASHFDAGFAYTIKDVLQLWWYTHFPRAVELGTQMEATKSPYALHFTAQCWLIDVFYNCPPNVPGLSCPTTEQQANVTLAIQKGWLTWHSFPFNSEAELHTADMLVAGIERCHALDDRFGFPHKATMSQRDVPGTTRSIIPVLASQGVTVFSEGVNGASTPPFVPRAFVWRDPNSNLTMPMLVHPYGYGDIQFEDAVIVPGLEHALVFAWRGDNAGPPSSVQEIANNYATVQGIFPGAQVFASTFDNFTQYLLQPDILEQLPVIEKEIGDTWMHGAASDPIRSAFFKRVSVLRSECLASGACSASDPVLQNFTRLALKCGEHTWGKDIKTFLHDTENWTNEQLQAQLAANASNFVGTVASWVEQRAWCIDYAVQALQQVPNHPLAGPVQAALADLYPDPAQPNPTALGYVPFTPGKTFSGARWSIAFSPATGGISLLTDAVTGQMWASPSDGSFLAVPEYVTLSAEDYAIFTGPEGANGEGYYPFNGESPSWFQLDFGKPNVSSASPVHQEVQSSLTGLWIKQSGSVASFLVSTAFADPQLHSYYGAPAAMWTQVDVPTGATDGTINITFSMYNKTATRLPEGFFLRFNASATYGSAGTPAPLAWGVSKLGGNINPFDVVPGGNQHQHGFTGGVSASKHDPAGVGASATLAILTNDATMAHVGVPFPLPTPVLNASDASEGLSMLLIDNTWGTNYPAWIPWFDGDENERWRFQLVAQ